MSSSPTSFLSLCQSKARDQSSVKALVGSADALKEFFVQFETFLGQSHSKSRWKKSPNKVFEESMKAVRTIIEATYPHNFTEPMIEPLQQAFKRLFHPMNTKKIRGVAVSLFFDLIDHLGDKAYRFIGDVSPFVLNSSLLEKKWAEPCKLDPGFNEHRIQGCDGGREDMEALDAQLKMFFLKLQENPGNFNVMWLFFQRMILDMVYPLPNTKMCNTGPIPLDLLSPILNVMMEVAVDEKKFRLVYEQLDAKRYFFDVAMRCVINGKVDIVTYVEQLFIRVCEGGEKGGMVKTPIEIVYKGIHILLGIQQAVTTEKDKKRMLHSLHMFIVSVFKTFDHKDLTEATRLVILWDGKGLEEVLKELIGTLLSENVTDECIWKLVGEGNGKTTYWTVLTMISRHYAMCAWPSLLCLKKEVKEIMDKNSTFYTWCGGKDPLDEYLETDQRFAGLSESFLGMILSLDWMGHVKPETCVRLYEVTDAFVKVLIDVACKLPDDSGVDVSCIFERFLDWLMKACGPCNNSKIESLALQRLGQLISHEVSAPLLSDDILSKWFAILLLHINSTDDTTRLNGVRFGCKAISVGLRGHAVLHEKVLENIDVFDSLCDWRVADALSVMHAPIENYKRINESIRGAALGRRMMNDILDGKKDEIREATDLMIELLKKFSVVQVQVIGPVMLIVNRQIADESERVIDCILEILREQEDKQSSKVYDEYVGFVCSMIIYANSEHGLSRLITVSQSWNSTSLQYALLTTAVHFGRFPKSIAEALPVGDFANFASNIDHVLSVANGTIVSAFPTGRHVWSFTPACGQVESAEPSVQQTPVLPTNDLEFVCESEFSTRVEGYVNNMLDGTIMKTSNPEEFLQIDVNQDAVPVTEEPSTVQLRRELTCPGSCTAAFMSSFGFFEPITNEHLRASFGTVSPRVPRSCRECIRVGFSSAGESPHFAEFKSGLGFVMADGITFSDFSVELSYEAGVFRYVQIVWCQGMPYEDILKTYSQDETRVRIEIRTKPNGTFAVKTLLHNSITERNGVLSEITVEKRVLPMFIVAWIRAVVHRISTRKPASPLLDSGIDHRKAIEQSFVSQSAPFSCERSLLAEVCH